MLATYLLRPIAATRGLYRPKMRFFVQIHAQSKARARPSQLLEAGWVCYETPRQGRSVGEARINHEDDNGRPPFEF